jgi:HK97 family phage portal protein
MAQSSDRLNFLQRTLLWGARKSLSWGQTTVVADNQKLTDHEFIERVLGGKVGARPITEFSAMQITAVWSCVRVLTETIGALPLDVFTKDDRGAPKKIDHDLTELLTVSPNADMTPQEFGESQIMNTALRGNGYAEISRLLGRPTSVYPIPACDVTPERTPRGLIQFRVAGRRDPVPADLMWHLKGFGSNGLEGLSPIRYAAGAMGLAGTLEQFSSQFFQNGAHIGGVVSNPNWLTKDQRETAREIVEGKYSGMVQAHKLMLLEGGMKYERISIPPEEAQFLESRGFQINEICRIFRVPPHMVADLTKSSFSNIEQMSLDFVQFTLMPYLVRREQSAAKALLKPAELGKVFIRHNFEGLLRADSAARAALYTVMLDKGVKTRNEVRALENMPRSDEDGMDDFTVQAQMVPISKLGEAPVPAATPATVPTGE